MALHSWPLSLTDDCRAHPSCHRPATLHRWGVRTFLCLLVNVNARFISSVVLLLKHQKNCKGLGPISLGVPTCGDSTVAISCAPLTLCCPSLPWHLPLVHKSQYWFQMQSIVQSSSMSVYHVYLIGTVWIVDLNCMQNTWCSVQVIL